MKIDFIEGAKVREAGVRVGSQRNLTTVARGWVLKGVLAAMALQLGACTDARVRVDVQRLKTDLEDARGFQAEQTAKISSLENDVRRLSGRVDEIEFQQNQRFGSALNTIKGDLTSLRRRIPPPAIVPVVELEADEDALLSLPGELAAPMSEALAGVRDGNFGKALESLDQAMGPAFEANWVAGVIFWKAVSLEGMNNPRGAIEQYLALSSQYPTSERMPTVLLRQASVFVRLGDKRAARAALNKLISDHPRSAQANPARQKIKELGR